MGVMRSSHRQIALAACIVMGIPLLGAVLSHALRSPTVAEDEKSSRRVTIHDSNSSARSEPNRLRSGHDSSTIPIATSSSLHLADQSAFHSKKHKTYVDHTQVAWWESTSELPATDSTIISQDQKNSRFDSKNRDNSPLLVDEITESNKKQTLPNPLRGIDQSTEPGLQKLAIDSHAGSVTPQTNPLRKIHKNPASENLPSDHKLETVPKSTNSDLDQNQLQPKANLSLLPKLESETLGEREQTDKRWSLTIETPDRVQRPTEITNKANSVEQQLLRPPGNPVEGQKLNFSIEQLNASFGPTTQPTTNASTPVHHARQASIQTGFGKTPQNFASPPEPSIWHQETAVEQQRVVNVPQTVPTITAQSAAPLIVQPTEPIATSPLTPLPPVGTNSAAINSATSPATVPTNLINQKPVPIQVAVQVQNAQVPPPPTVDPYSGGERGAAEADSRIAVDDNDTAQNNVNQDQTLGEEPEIDTDPQFLRQDTILLEPGERQIEVGIQYLTDTIDFTMAEDQGGQIVVSEARTSQRVLLLPVEFRMGLAPNTQGFVLVPVGWANTEFSFANRDNYKNVGGLGDISAGVTEVLIEGDKNFPDILGAVAFTAPTGQANFASTLSASGASLGEGFWSITAGITAIKTYDPIVIFYGAGYRHRFKAEFDNVVNGDTIEIEPGAHGFYRFGVGFALNPNVTISASFTGNYIEENNIDGIRIPGDIREPMQLRFATTISEKTDSRKQSMFSKMENAHGNNANSNSSSVQTVEPFVMFGMTDRAADVIIGCSWTR